MKVICSCLFFIVHFFLISQEDKDSLFARINQSAKEENYTLAIEMCKKLIEEHPENSDYQLYLGRIYFWKGDHALALEIVESLMTQEDFLRNPSEEMYRLYIQLLLSNQQFEKSLIISSFAINTFSSEAEFYKLQKASALIALKTTKEAIFLLEEIKKDSPHYTAAQYLKTLALKQLKNSVSIGYLNTSFSNPGFSPWHFAHIQYKRSVSNCDYIGRINLGSMNGVSSMQGEIDIYPKIGKKSYLYLNAGASDGKSIFPGVRIGTELFHDFKKLTVSLGGRYIHFNTAQVIMLTGHLGRNFNSYHISYRPYIVYQNGNWFDSHILNLRKSFEQKETYIQLELQYGAVPYYFFITDEFLRTTSYRAGINCHIRIKDNFFIQPILMYEFEEYFPSNFRNRFNVQVILSKRF